MSISGMPKIASNKVSGIQTMIITKAAKMKMKWQSVMPVHNLLSSYPASNSLFQNKSSFRFKNTWSLTCNTSLETA